MTYAAVSADARPSSTPISRGLGFERSLITVLALVLLAAGLLGLAVGFGLLGRYRAQRPVLDPLVVQWIGGSRTLFFAVGLAIGVVLVLLGIWWLLRSLRPEGRPNMQLDSDAESSATVTAGALSDAVRTDAEQVTGVSRARARMAGSAQRPALRLTLSLQEGTDVRNVWEELDEKVLSRARQALEVEALPTSIRLQLDRAARQRVR